MRVLLHSKVFYPSVGGFERVSETLAEILHTRGIDVQILTDTPLSGAPEVGPYPVIRGSSSTEKRKLVHEADIVHVRGFCLELLFPSLLYRKPIVWTHSGHQASCLTGNGFHEGRLCNHRWHRCLPLTYRQYGARRTITRAARLLLGRLALHLANRNVCASKWVAQHIWAVRSSVIWNPVRVGSFNPLATPKYPGRFTYVGRLVTEKGVDVLLRALSVCHERGKSYGLDVYGDGPERDNLEQLALRFRLSGKVMFHGTVRNEKLAQAVNQAWVVVVPTACEEAMGIVAVEAMAAGKPLIVSRKGGLTEISEGCSLTFENGDHRELADRMIFLAENEDLRVSLAQHGPERARLFAPERIINNYLAIYREILKR